MDNKEKRPRIKIKEVVPVEKAEIRNPNKFYYLKRKAEKALKQKQ